MDGICIALEKGRLVARGTMARKDERRRIVDVRRIAIGRSSSVQRSGRQVD